MLKMNCGVQRICSNGTYKLKKWKEEVFYDHKDLNSNCKREDCIHCIPPFRLYCFSNILRQAELRNKCFRDKSSEIFKETK